MLPAEQIDNFFQGFRKLYLEIYINIPYLFLIAGSIDLKTPLNEMCRTSLNVHSNFFSSENTHNTHIQSAQHIHQTSKEGNLSQGLSQIL